MRDFSSERVTELARHIIETGDTVRATAKLYGISKSTVHKDVSDRLLHIDRNLFGQVDAVLQKNKSERHIRGGLATKRKYKGE